MCIGCNLSVHAIVSLYLTLLTFGLLVSFIHIVCIRGCIYLVYIDLPGHLCMVQLICVHNYLCSVQLMHEILWYVLLCQVATGTLLVVTSSRMFVIYLIIPGYPNHCKYFGNKLASQNETQLHQPELQGPVYHVYSTNNKH